MCPNNAAGVANSVDPDQTAPFWEQSDLGLHCLLSSIYFVSVSYIHISKATTTINRYASLH